MNSLLDSIFGSASPAPRIETWPPEMVLLHGLAEAALGIASLVIAVAVVLLVRRSRRMPAALRTVTMLLGAFVFLGGAAHLAGLLTVWFPVYRGAGILRLIAASVAVAAALVLLRLLPRLAAIPSPEALRTANQRLVEEARAREEAYRQVDESRRALEEEVRRRTRELAEVTQLFEAATAGAEISVAAQDADLRYTWVHNTWLGEPEAVVGHRDQELLPATGRDQVIASKREALATGRQRAFEVELAAADGGPFWRRFDVTPLKNADGAITGLVSISHDITRGKRLEAMRGDLSRRLAETVQQFNLALRSGDIYVFSLDEQLSEVWSNRPQNPFGPLLSGDAGPRGQEVLALLNEAMGSREARYAEIAVGSGNERNYYDLHVEPRVEAEGEVVGVVCAAVDVSERKRNEQRMRLVMRELSHRSKNLLSVVQAIARQTAQQAEDVPAFVESFGQRLRSLAGAQDLLVADNWVGADLASLVRSQIEPYAPPEADRVHVSGPPVRLTPQATQAVGLAMHELATNAAKHGAFANHTGEIHVGWRIEPPAEPAGPMLHLIWREAGGPPVAPPQRRGFGRVVVEFNVARSLNAEVDLQFPPSGVLAEFRIPTQHLVEMGREHALFAADGL